MRGKIQLKKAMRRAAYWYKPFQSLIHEGENSTIETLQHIILLKLEFQSLIHEGENSTPIAIDWDVIRPCEFQSLIHEGENSTVIVVVIVNY